MIRTAKADRGHKQYYSLTQALLGGSFYVPSISACMVISQSLKGKLVKTRLLQVNSSEVSSTLKVLIFDRRYLSEQLFLLPVVCIHTFFRSNFAQLSFKKPQYIQIPLSFYSKKFSRFEDEDPMKAGHRSSMEKKSFYLICGMLKVTRHALIICLKRIILVAIADLQLSGNIFREQERFLGADSLNSVSCGVKAKASSLETFLLTSSARLKGCLISGHGACSQVCNPVMRMSVIHSL